MDVQLCRSENLLENVARSVRQTDAAGALPVADSPAGRRLVEQLAGAAGASPPRHTGAVACIGGDAAAPLAQLLAVRTGRRLIEFSSGSRLQEWASQEPVTLVATSAQVSNDFLARISTVRMTGVLTARDLDALSALVARSVVGLVTPLDRTLTVDTVRSAPGDRNPTSRDEFLANVGDGVSVLGVTAHGRECMLILDDVVICGRAPAPRPLTIEPGASFLGQTSCQWEEGCIRNHWSEDRLLPAAEVRAALVFIDSCAAMKTGTSQFDSSTAMALSWLDGDALAVVCSPWPRDGMLRLPDVFCAAVSGGVSLGEAVALVNEAVARSGRSLGFFSLLGDAGLHPFPQMAAPATRDAGSGGTIVVPACGARIQLAAGQFGRITMDGPVIAVRVADDELLVAPSPPQREPVLAQLAVRDASVRSSIVRLAEAARAYGDIWCLGVRLKQAPLADLRRHLLECYDGSADRVPATEMVTSRVDAAWEVASALDREIADQLVWATARTHLPLIERYGRHSEREYLGMTACPQCGQAAEINSWQHIVSAMRRQLVSCHACWELIDRDMANAAEVRLAGPVHGRRGEVLPQRAEVTCRGNQEASGWLGYVLANGERHGGDSLDRIAPFAVSPGSSTSVDLGAEISPDFGLADRLYLRAFAVCAGRVSVYSRAVWISPGADSHPHAVSADGTGGVRSEF
jgi:hypothetical protein